MFRLRAHGRSEPQGTRTTSVRSRTGSVTPDVEVRSSALVVGVSSDIGADRHGLAHWRSQLNVPILAGGSREAAEVIEPETTAHDLVRARDDEDLAPIADEAIAVEVQECSRARDRKRAGR